jgi:predicted nucleic acid-binding protein
MENLRKGDIIDFIPVSENISILAGELKCKYNFLSMVDAIIIAEALTRKIFIYTTETHFEDIDNLKVKKINY